MMRRTLGLVFIAGLTLSALPSAPATAAASAPLVVSDPKGDAVDKRASMDIVSLGIETKTLKKGNPPSLVITMKLAAAPEAQLAAYEVNAEIPNCGSFRASYTPGTVYAAQAASAQQLFVCNGKPSPDSLTLTFLKGGVKGDSITWAIAVDSLPKAARLGKKLTNIHGLTAVAEPVTGIIHTYSLVNVPDDEAKTPKEFTFA